jgi:hypothetical protein
LTPKSTKTQNHFKINNQIRSDEGLAHFLLGMFTLLKGSGFCKISYQNGLRAKDDEHLIISD